MSLYCAAVDLTIPAEELAELTTESGSSADSGLVTAAIAKASREIDAYVGARYPVPLSPVPELVAGICADLAAYYLYPRRDMIPEARRQAYEDRIALLTRIGKGDAVIPGAAVDSAAPALGRSDISSAPREFTRDSLRGF